MNPIELISNMNFTLIGKLMLLEFIAGATIGYAFKLVSKLKATVDSNLQVLPVTEYSFQNPSRQIPKNAFDAFAPSPEFVIIKSLDGKVVSEQVFSFFGAFSQAVYVDGEHRGYEYSATTSPMYLCIVFLPLVVGFLSLLFSYEDEIFNSLFCSGVVWLFTTTAILNLREIIRFTTHPAE